MQTKISDELLGKCRQAELEEPQREIPVIITVRPNTNLTVLERKGLKDTHAYENIPAVSGTLVPAAVADLAGMDEVEKIEYDGTVEALEE